ncbi:DUF6659 family protein [Nitrosopumilus sp.]|uniref:DUF6659 family protein n=1 Tax=Nitrosopumilus sp. TaxID=2024843 RepID=UPI003B5BE6E1
MTTPKIVDIFSKKCDKILDDEPYIRFAGVINRYGRLIAGGFRKGVEPFIDDSKSKMVYMQMCLEWSMRKEFDDTLGPIKWIASRRENVVMVSIPISEHLLLISTEPVSQVGSISKRARETFREYL